MSGLTVLTFEQGLLVIILLETALFLWGTIQKNWAVADIGWGFIPALLCGLFMYRLHEHRNLLILCLTIIAWGIRLAIYLALRQKGKAEDFRYAAWRKQWGERGNVYLMSRSFLQIFILQGVLLSIVLLPVILPVDLRYLSDVKPLFITGVFLWTVGFLIESISDIQKHQFRKSKANENTPCRTGFWKYSRHPNYLGEILLWWGIGLMGISHVGILSLISPLVVTYLIIYVSGLPFLEKKYRRDANYRSYLQETAPLIPGIRHWP